MKGRRYKLCSSGEGNEVGGVGVMVKGEPCEKELEVRRISVIEMTVVVFEEDVLELICRNPPQSGRSLEEKQSFYDELKCEWDTHSAGDLVMFLGDINGHLCRHIDGFDGDHGGYGGNLKGRMLLQF